MKNEQVGSAQGGFYVTIATAAGSTTKKVEGDMLTVGRADDCHLTISHETLSRRHLTVSLRDGTCWIEDHASSNGTYVNGRRIAAHSLTRVMPEDVITMGQATVRLSVSAEPVMPKGGSPPVELGESTGTHSKDTIVTSTQHGRRNVGKSEPGVAAKMKEKEEANEQAERMLQDAQKRAANLIQEAEVEAERRAEDIYRRAHETQAKMDEVYAKRMSEAYRASEQIYQKSQEESQSILDAARTKSNEIRQQAENFVMELRRRTEGDCERLLEEAQQTARDLKEQRLLEAEDVIRKKSEDLVEQTRQAMDKRMTRFEDDLNYEAKRQRDELEAELTRRRYQLEMDLKDQTESLQTLKDEVKQLADLKAREQHLLAEAEAATKKQTDQLKALKGESDEAKNSVVSFNRQLADLRTKIDGSDKEMKDLENRIQSGKDLLQQIDRDAKAAQTRMNDELRAAQARVGDETRAAADRVSQVQEQSNAILVQLRAKLEEDKAKLEKAELAHLEELKLRTTRKVRELETQLVEELHSKKERLTRELALVVEAHLKEQKTADSRALQDLIGKHMKKEIVSISNEEGAKTKQASLIALKRQQKILAVLTGVVAGAVLMFVGERVEQHLRVAHSPMQNHVTAMQEQRKAELELRRFNPPQTPEFKTTYMDNVIYTDGFVGRYNNEEFQKRFMQALTPYMLKTWKIEEDQVFQLLGITSALVKQLAEKKANIHPDFVPQGLEKMKEAENEALARVRSLLGSTVRVESFRKFEKQFYEKYDGPVDIPLSEERTPSGTPPTESGPPSGP